MMSEITTIAAAIGAILGILNFLIWCRGRKPEINVEVVSTTSELQYQERYFIDIELLVLNKSEKDTSVHEISFESDCFMNPKEHRPCAPRFIAAHASDRFKEKIQCKKSPDKCKIKITVHHTHGKCEITVEHPVKRH